MVANSEPLLSVEISSDTRLSGKVKGTVIDELRQKLIIPNPIYESIDSGNQFYIYEKIPGISLSRIFNKVPQKDKMKIAKQLGKIITELHSLQESHRDLVKKLSLFRSSDQYFQAQFQKPPGNCRSKNSASPQREYGAYAGRRSPSQLDQ